MSSLKLKGKKLFSGDKVVAEIFGSRCWLKGVPHGGYGYKLASGERTERCFAYFSDAVAQARFAVKDAEPTASGSNASH